MRRERDRMFDEATRSFSLARPAMGLGVMAPRVDVKETETGIEVQLKDGVLTIKGEKRQEREEKEKGCT
jgi:HSP20 family molecular chaperone IbpA